MIEFNQREQDPGEGGGLSIAVVGVGGAGANVLDRIALEGMTEAELVCMNTDIRALTNSVAATKVQLGKNLTQGLGAGGDPDLGEDAARSSEEEIRNAVRGKDMVFVCGGLGGGTGSGGAPFISGIARSEGAFVVAFTTMPFSFEGRRRLSQAQQSLNHLRKTANALITFDNDRMGSLVLPKQGIQEAFAEADKIISQSVRAVIQLVTKPGLISIGMDDLITALDNDDSRCLFGYGQATGENRAQEALSKALKSPLLDKGEMLDEAQNVLVHVCGGDSMTLFEVELLMKSLEKEVSDKAQILFGVGSDPKLGDKLSVTVISSMGKLLPPTAEDDAHKAVRAGQVPARESGASVAPDGPEAQQSSRSEVNPDQPRGAAAGIPVAAAATTLSASLLSGAVPAAKAASVPTRARISPIRRAVQPVETPLTPKGNAGGSPSEAGASAGGAGPESRERAFDPPVARPGTGGKGKGVLSIFDDDDEDDDNLAPEGKEARDDEDDLLDDDLDLMGDLGLDDDELDRLVAESAATGLDDDEDAAESEEPIPLLEDEGLRGDLISEEELDRAIEEEISAEAESLGGVEPEPDAPQSEAPAASTEPATEPVPAVSAPAAEPVGDIAAWEKTPETKEPADGLGEAPAGAAEDVPESEDGLEDDDALEKIDSEMLPEESDDDFASVDDEELEEITGSDDVLAEVLEEEIELGTLQDEDFLEVAGEDDVELVASGDDLEVGGDDPFFAGEETEVRAAVDMSPKTGPADVAPVPGNKADALLKRVGLRRAEQPAPAQEASVERPALAAGKTPGALQGTGKAPFAWSKPGEGSTKPLESSAAEVQPGRTQLPPARTPAAEAADAGKDPGPVAPASGDPVAEGGSPFIPRGFLHRKAPQPEVEPRRGLPARPTALKLEKQAPPEAAVSSEPVFPAEAAEAARDQDFRREEPQVTSRPEQQTFDSSLEPQKKGRFDKGEPTVEDGEDLDLPTFLRRKKG